MSVCSRSSCPPPRPGAALAADGVDLVDEDDGRRLLAGRLEEVADPAGADADEHLHEVRAADRHEGHARLAGHGPGQQRLAGPGRADEQHALGDLGPDLLEAGRGLQEVDDLADLLLDPGVAGHVVEGGRGPVAAEGLGLGAADRHDPRHLSPGLAPDEVDEGGADADDEDVGEEGAEEARRRRREADLHAVVPAWWSRRWAATGSGPGPRSWSRPSRLPVISPVALEILAVSTCLDVTSCMNLVYVIVLALVVLIVPTASRMATIPMARTPQSQRQL